METLHMARESHWFRAAVTDTFCHKKKDASGRHVLVVPHATSSLVLRCMVEAIYSGKLSITGDNMVDLIKCSDAMQMPMCAAAASRALATQAQQQAQLLAPTIVLLISVPGSEAEGHRLMAAHLGAALAGRQSGVVPWCRLCCPWKRDQRRHAKGLNAQQRPAPAAGGGYQQCVTAQRRAVGQGHVAGSCSSREAAAKHGAAVQQQQWRSSGGLAADHCRQRTLARWGTAM